jgi:hypothetical protein
LLSNHAVVCFDDKIKNVGEETNETVAQRLCSCVTLGFLNLATSGAVARATVNGFVREFLSRNEGEADKPARGFVE